MKKVGGISLLKVHINRIKKSKKSDAIMVATTTNKEDDIICEEANQLNVNCYRGSEHDVLDRFYKSVSHIKPDYIVRLTSDCPLIDWNLIDFIVDETIIHNCDYCSNTLIDSFPDGQDVEVINFKSLEKAWIEAKLPSEREHVTPYIKKNSNFHGKNIFKAKNIISDEIIYKDVRMTVDQIEDFEVISILVERLGLEDNWKNYAYLYHTDSSIKDKNSMITRNEGYIKSLKNEKN